MIDEIRSIAEESGLAKTAKHGLLINDDGFFIEDEVIAFAERIAEACAKIADSYDGWDKNNPCYAIAEDIRNRFIKQ